MNYKSNFQLHIEFLFISESGLLYTFGETDDGKLGEGDETIDNTSPVKVDVKCRIKTVACGGSHTIAITGKYRKNNHKKNYHKI